MGSINTWSRHFSRMPALYRLDFKIGSPCSSKRIEQIAKYANCKKKSPPRCPCGRLFVRAIEPTDRRIIAHHIRNGSLEVRESKPIEIEVFRKIRFLEFNKFIFQFKNELFSFVYILFYSLLLYSLLFSTTLFSLSQC